MVEMKCFLENGNDVRVVNYVRGTPFWAFDPTSNMKQLAGFVCLFVCLLGWNSVFGAR